MAIRVLLVDDNSAHVELLRLLLELDDDLELAGVAADGEVGVALAAERQPDLIVSDIEMPRLNGLQAVPHYRQAAPAAAVVLMSSRYPGEAGKQAAAAGADAYIDKGTGVDSTITRLKAITREVQARAGMVDRRDTHVDPIVATQQDTAS